MRDKNKRKQLFGVATNDADYYVRPIINGKPVVCPYYQKWHSKHPTYTGCTVCDEWLIFSYFKSWMERQDWIGKELDKDILAQGNGHYSPETCLFVSHAINSLLNDNKAKRGLYPVGVSFKKQNNKFQAYIKINGIKKHLGLFSTPELAYKAYKTAKYELIKQVALQQEEPLRSALLNYKIEGR